MHAHTFISTQTITRIRKQKHTHALRAKAANPRSYYSRICTQIKPPLETGEVGNHFERQKRGIPLLSGVLFIYNTPQQRRVLVAPAPSADLVFLAARHVCLRSLLAMR